MTAAYRTDRPTHPPRHVHYGVVGDEWAGSDDEIARAALDSSPNAVVALDRDQSVLVWNAAAERVFGWAAEEVLGRRAPIVPGELTAEHNAVLERVRTGEPVSLRTKRLHSDGALLDLRVDISALRLGSAVGGYVCVYHPARADELARNRMARRARLVQPAHRRGRRHQLRAGAVGRARPDLGQPHRADRGGQPAGSCSSRVTGCGW